MTQDIQRLINQSRTELEAFKTMLRKQKSNMGRLLVASGSIK